MITQVVIITLWSFVDRLGLCLRIGILPRPLGAQLWRSGLSIGGGPVITLWFMVIDDLLCRLDGQGYKAIGYANDLVVIVTDKFEDALSNIMNSALQMVVNWCSVHGFSINPGKTILVPFTTRRQWRMGVVSVSGMIL